MAAGKYTLQTPVLTPCACLVMAVSLDIYPHLDLCLWRCGTRNEEDSASAAKADKLRSPGVAVPGCNPSCAYAKVKAKQGLTVKEDEASKRGRSHDYGPRSSYADAQPELIHAVPEAEL